MTLHLERLVQAEKAPAASGTTMDARNARGRRLGLLLSTALVIFVLVYVLVSCAFAVAGATWSLI